MAGEPDVARALHTELVARLRASGDTDPAQRRHQFRLLAEDYRTLALMDELPEHAEGAHAAWRRLLPERPETLARRELLRLLSAAYADAADGP